MIRTTLLSLLLFFSSSVWAQAFDEACYLNRYPDVVANWVNNGGRAIDHWNQRGQFENRIPGCTNQTGGSAPSSSVFNESCYLQRYPDVQQNWVRGGGTAIGHWNQNGQREGRIPGCGAGIQPAPVGGAPAPVAGAFNEACYLQRYPDVAANWRGPAIDHWNQNGQREGRIPGCDAGTQPAPGGSAPVAGTFNESCYLQRYPDVAANWRGPAIDHWNQNGQREGRIPGCGGGIQPIAGGTPPSAPVPTPNPAPVGNTPIVVTGTTIVGGGAVPIAITVDGPRFGGAVSSLNWNGKEFINIHDHGRQLQSAMQVDGYKECNNPTEAGSEHDGTGSRSSSVMTGFAKQAPNVMLTQANMAYWNWRGVTGACVRGKDPRVNQPLSNHLLNKRIQIGEFDDPRLIKYDVQFQHPAGSYNESLTYEFLTGYLTPEFIQYSYILPNGGLRMVDASSNINISGNGFPPGSFQSRPAGKGHYDPIILSNASGSHAMGVYVPRSQLVNCKSNFHGYGMYYFNLGGSGPNAAGTAKWSLAVDDSARSSCIRNNTRSFVVYLAVGTLAEVHQSIVRAMGRVK